jgi:hypothetical protein
VLAAGTQPLSVAFTPTDAADYTNATASVSITVNPAIQTASSPDANVYVASNPSNSVEIYAFSAAADGTLTPLTGSPFPTGVSLMAANRNYLFGTNGIDINSFSIAPDGTFSAGGFDQCSAIEWSVAKWHVLWRAGSPVS